MQIEFTKAYRTESGVFSTLDEAQREAIKTLLNIDANAVVDAIMFSKDDLVDILTTTATSKPKARKVNGGKKTRKAKADPAAPELLPETAK